MKTCITALVVAAGALGFAGTAQAHHGTYAKLVDSWYHRYLGRHVDPIGLRSHVIELERGTPVDFVEASILGSQEYFLRNGATPQGLIVGFFRDVLGTVPTPGDMKHWMRHYYQDIASRHVLALRFLREMRIETVVPYRGYVGPVVVPPPVVVAPPFVTPTIVTPRPVYVPEPVYVPRTTYSPLSFSIRLWR